MPEYKRENMTKCMMQIQRSFPLMRFNSSLVRLMAWNHPAKPGRFASFNSSLVRLMVCLKLGKMEELICFNSSLVRLMVSCVSLKVQELQFQFQLGAINGQNTDQ